eukprot:scpid50430/ scgid24890/ Protein regulator of cytokinesis 1
MDESWRSKENVTSLVSCMHDDTSGFVSGLWKLWQELGYMDDVCQERLQTARNHLSELMSEMNSEEQHAVESLRDLTRILTEECRDLAKELAVDHTQPSHGKLLAYHDAIKAQRDEMRTERARRLKEYDILVNEERRLCDCMRLEATRFSPKRTNSRRKPVPSQQLLDQLSRNLADLQTKEMTRKNQFLSSRSEILDFCQQLDCELADISSDDFTHAVACPDVAQFVLSIENLKALETLRKKLSDQVADLGRQGEALEAKITLLWQDLSMEHDQELLDRHSSHSGRDVKALEAIAAKLHEEKMSHLEHVIRNVRKAISQLHDRLSYGSRQREEFRFMLIDEFSCETLEAHQAERQRLQSELDHNTDLYRLLQRRENAWKTKLQYEQTSGDLSRYDTRGGRLLKEQKQRQKLERELPKIEDELRALIKSWEHRTGRRFVAFDEVYTQHVAAQWEDLTASKEEKKQKRKEQKLANIEEERANGSKAPPTTPLKMRSVVTPTSARSKSRIDCSVVSANSSQRVMHSSLRGAFSNRSTACSSANASNVSMLSTSRHAASGLTPVNRVTRSMATTKQRLPMTGVSSNSSRQPSHLVTGGRAGVRNSAKSRARANPSSTSSTTSSMTSSASTCNDENNPNMSMSSVSYAAFKTGLALGPGGSVDTSHCCATSVGQTTFV